MNPTRQSSPSAHNVLLGTSALNASQSPKARKIASARTTTEIASISTPCDGLYQATEEIYDDPWNLFVAGFIGPLPMNLIEGAMENRRFIVAGAAIAALGRWNPRQRRARDSSRGPRHHRVGEGRFDRATGDRLLRRQAPVRESHGDFHLLVGAIMRTAGIEGSQACPRGLRRSYGVAAVTAGVPLPTIAAVLGHASLTTTAIYTTAIGTEAREFVSRVWA